MVAYVPAADDKPVGMHIHGQHAKSLLSLQRVCGKQSVPDLQAARVYDRELLLPYQNIVAERSVDVSGEGDDLRVLVKYRTRLSVAPVEGVVYRAERRHVIHQENRLAGIRLARRRDLRLVFVP